MVQTLRIPSNAPQRTLTVQFYEIRELKLVPRIKLIPDLLLQLLPLLYWQMNFGWTGGEFHACRQSCGKVRIAAPSFRQGLSGGAAHGRMVTCVPRRLKWGSTGFTRLSASRSCPSLAQHQQHFPLTPIGTELAWWKSEWQHRQAEIKIFTLKIFCILLSAIYDVQGLQAQHYSLGLTRMTRRGLPHSSSY